MSTASRPGTVFVRRVLCARLRGSGVRYACAEEQTLLIPEHKIQEVLDRVDIVAVVSRHVELKKAGKSYRGKCPFHQEKSASFYVTPDIRRFKCFGCQAGGDAIAFIQRYLGKTFVDSVRDLAREVNVDLESAVDPAARERQQLKQATDFAAEHFKQRLWDEQRGQKARTYLRSRQVSDETAKNFGLGWAPPEYGDLTDRLLKEGMLEWAVDAGLVKRREGRDGFFDAFRSRLMVPIRSPEGRTIAFGGRFLELEPLPPDRKPPKYLNSKESRLYNKSEVLFGMDQARDEIRRSKSAVLVEGYFDCIALHDAGVKNAVALCSTALTPQHMALLARCDAKELVLLLDGDEAGRKAVERLAGPILAAGFASRVASLPEGEDPDTFAHNAGADGVRALLETAKPLTGYLFETVLPGGTEATFEDKMKGIDRLKPICAQLPVGLTRSALFAAISKHFGLPAADLETALRGREAAVRPVPKPQSAPPAAAGSQSRPTPAQAVTSSARHPNPAGGPRAPSVPGRSGPGTNSAPVTATGPAGASAAPARPADKPPDQLEATFAAALFRNPRLLHGDEHRVHDELSHTGLRSILQQLATGGRPSDLIEDASEGVKTALSRAARELPPETEMEPFFAEVCRRLKLRRVDEQLTYIARVTGRLQGAHDLDEETRRLIEQRVELLELKKKLVVPTPQGSVA